MLLVVLTGTGAAVLLAVGFVLQQRAAAMEPPDQVLAPTLLLHLLRRRQWLAGIATMVAGQALGAWALDMGDLALVEPLLAANLLFALPLSAALARRHLGVREWAGAVMLSGGLAGFIALGSPHGGRTTHLPWPNWALAGGLVLAAVTALVHAAKRTTLGEEATLLATAAGVLYGLGDALTRRAFADLPHGVVAVLTSWPAPALVVVGVIGLWLAQSAFEAAPLAASLPAITIAEPVTGIALGVGVYGEHLRLAPLPLAGEVACLAAAVAGVVLVARSPLVARAVPEQAQERRRRHAESEAVQRAA